MSEEKPKAFPAVRLLVGAALAGALAGAAAVYVVGMPSGNTGAAGESVVEHADNTACAAKAEAAKAVGEAAGGEVAAMLAADPPQGLRMLGFDDPEAQPMTLSDRAGKVLLVNLWATWCAPCRAEMPALDALQKARGGDDFEVVAVNIDTGDDTKPKAFLAETGVTSLAYYRDRTMGIFNDLKTRGLALGLPVTLLVDRDGCLLAHMNGPADWASGDAAALIEAAVAHGAP